VIEKRNLEVGPLQGHIAGYLPRSIRIRGNMDFPAPFRHFSQIVINPSHSVISGITAIVALLCLSAWPVCGQELVPADGLSEIRPLVMGDQQIDSLIAQNSPNPSGNLLAPEKQVVLPPTEYGFFETIDESIRGDARAPGRWRPLSLDTFFTEGWLEPFAFAPPGQDGVTPRQSWLGAFDGAFYRGAQAALTYGHQLQTPFGGNSYAMTVSPFIPFSRRFQIAVNVPVVVANGTLEPGRGYQSNLGDVTITPRFLLSESKTTTQVFAMDIHTPTGQVATGGGSTGLNPRYEFWTNTEGAWVVRGAAGLYVPLNTSHVPGQTTVIGGVSLGRYFRNDEKYFGKLVFYGSANMQVPLSGDTSHSYVAVGPGTRFHISDNYYFLHYWEFPVSHFKPNDYTMQLAVVKIY
jgi:hypothetical protein